VVLCVQGSYLYPDSSMYTGGWKAGRKHGQGEFACPDTVSRPLLLVLLLLLVVVVMVGVMAMVMRQHQDVLQEAPV